MELFDPPGFHGLVKNSPQTMLVRISDNDPAGAAVDPQDLVIEEEDANGATYSVKMRSQPVSTITMTIGGAGGTDLTVSPARLTFTSSNWEEPQTVTVTAAHDADTADDRVTLTHRMSGGRQDNIRVDSVTVRVRDNDKGVNFWPPTLTLEEGDAAGATYEVFLNRRPTGIVTVDITGQAGTDLALSETGLTFTRQNWDVPQEVSVTAAKDADGAVDTATLHHDASGADYDHVPTSDLTVTVEEESLVSVAPTDITVLEGDTEGATYTVTLLGEPTADVTVTVERRGSDSIRLSPSILTFTAGASGNWSQPQTVTVTGATDDDNDADRAILRHTAAGGYEGVDIAEVSVTSVEPDLFAIELTPPSIHMPEGTTAVYTVELTHEPVGDGNVAVAVRGAGGRRFAQ